MCRKKPDPQVGPHVPEHAGHELEVIILHEHASPLRGEAGRGLGEASVHIDVGPPPLPVELRRLAGVVVERQSVLLENPS